VVVAMARCPRTSRGLYVCRMSVDWSQYVDSAADILGEEAPDPLCRKI
jgi:hypothetical protein